MLNIGYGTVKLEVPLLQKEDGIMFSSDVHGIRLINACVKMTAQC